MCNVSVAALLFCFVPDLTKESVLMIKRLTHTQKHTISLQCSAAGQQNGALLSHLQLCIFLLTQVTGYSTAGRSQVEGHLLLVPQPFLPLWSLKASTWVSERLRFIFLFLEKQRTFIIFVKSRWHVTSGLSRINSGYWQITKYADDQPAFSFP